MKTAILCLAWLIILTLAAVVSGEVVTTRSVENDRLITGEEQIPIMNPIPYRPNAATESPGIIVGTTFYDYQTNASTGRRIAYSPDHRAQMTWMNGLNWPTPRSIYYNWVDTNGNVYEPNGGCQISGATGGYPQFSLYQSIRGMIGYHQAGGTPPPYVMFAYEGDPVGECIWTYSNPPDSFPGAARLYWPYFDVDQRGWIHLVASENTTTRQRFFYTRSTNGGNSWTTLQFVDSIEVISAVVDASPVSGKVVIAYHQPGSVRTNIYNEIVYVQTTDGVNWNFGHPTYVTNYRNDNDSMWAYCDLDLLIDYNDNINIAWTAFWCPDSAHLYWPSHLYHYNSGTGQINLVRPPWPESSSWYSNCDPGGWNMPICKMSMGVNQISGCLFMIWTQFDTSDCSEGGYANGEIYSSSSCDNGQHWLPVPINLTNSHTPGCFAGDCESDHWASIAREVTPEMYSHILYINDKDAGGIPQTEGSPTENPVKYLKVEIPTGIEENIHRPHAFTLEQNYPNPFNSKTLISFELKKRSIAKMEVIDVTGGIVAVLLNRELAAGRHEVIFDAGKLASGIYYYKLTADGEIQTKKMVLVK